MQHPTGGSSCNFQEQPVLYAHGSVVCGVDQQPTCHGITLLLHVPPIGNTLGQSGSSCGKAHPGRACVALEVSASPAQRASTSPRSLSECTDAHGSAVVHSELFAVRIGHAHKFPCAELRTPEQRTGCGIQRLCSRLEVTLRRHTGTTVVRSGSTLRCSTGCSCLNFAAVSCVRTGSVTVIVTRTTDTITGSCATAIVHCIRSTGTSIQNFTTVACSFTSAITVQIIRITLCGTACTVVIVRTRRIISHIRLHFAGTVPRTVLVPRTTISARKCSGTSTGSRSLLRGITTFIAVAEPTAIVVTVRSCCVDVCVTVYDVPPAEARCVLRIGRCGGTRGGDGRVVVTLCNLRSCRVVYAANIQASGAFLPGKLGIFRGTLCRVRHVLWRGRVHKRHQHHVHQEWYKDHSCYSLCRHSCAC